MTIFKCGGCGYMHYGDEAPECCPKCGAPKSAFTVMEDDAAAKVTASERTNDLHMKISELAAKIDCLAKEGLEINLDPGCVDAFNASVKCSRVMKQSHKAEIAGHVGKGKW